MPWPDPVDHDQFATPNYLQAYARKARGDLYRVARMYNGLEVKLFTIDETGERCPECTDAFTGDIVISNCPTCGGTGYTISYQLAGTSYAVPQLAPKLKTSSEMGDIEVAQQNTWVLLGAPLLEDQDLVVTVDTRRVYKIVDMEPQLAAIGGEVITQTVICRALSKGAPEYKVLEQMPLPVDLVEPEEEVTP